MRRCEISWDGREKCDHRKWRALSRVDRQVRSDGRQCYVGTFRSYFFSARLRLGSYAQKKNFFEKTCVARAFFSYHGRLRGVSVAGGRPENGRHLAQTSYRSFGAETRSQFSAPSHRTLVIVGLTKCKDLVKASSRLRQGWFGGGEIRNLEGGWVGGLTRSTGAQGMCSLWTSASYMLRHLSRQQEGARHLLSPPRRCHCPRPYLCPAELVSAPSAKYHCLPADASWSQPLHGCHRLHCCYRERQPLSLLSYIYHSALRQGRRQSCARGSEAGAACVRTLQVIVVLLWWCGGETFVRVLLGPGWAKPPRRPTDDRQFGAGQPTSCTARLRCLEWPATRHYQRSAMPRCQPHGWHAMAWGGERSARGMRAGLAPVLSMHCRALARAYVCHRHLFWASRLAEDHPRRAYRHDNDCALCDLRYDIIHRGGSNRKKICASSASSTIFLSILIRSGLLWGKGPVLMWHGRCHFCAH